MNWYLKVIRDNYANFEGRARRKEYWMYTLVNSLLSLGLYALAIIGAISEIEVLMIIGFILLIGYTLATFVPSLALIVRRMHDIGKSGWMLFVSFIPFIGSIWMLVLLVTEGDHGENVYGEDPKSTEEF